MWDLQRFVNKTAIIDELGSQITYGELVQEGNRLKQIIGERCLIAVLCRNSIGSVVGYISFINNRIVPIMLNAHLDANLRDNILEKYSPKFIWAPYEMKDDFYGMEVVADSYDYVLLKTGFETEYPMYNELALLLTTSGSTGSPKFVRQSYQNIASNTDSIVEYLEIDADERPITTLPMNYTYGLSIINTHIKAGATILMTEKSLMQKEFWKFFKENQATSFGGVPYTYEILKKLRFMRMELPSLKTMTQAGGKLTPELQWEFAQYAQDHNKKFIVMYGQCEATARMAYLPAEKSLEKLGSMGIAIPGGTFILVDENENEITNPNMTGELVYKGLNVTLGYADCGFDLIKSDERNGVLKTGDMARRDEDGFYYIVGRKKRFLKVYGNRVNLDELEGMIKGNFENLESTCAGIDDHIYIFITENKNVSEIKEFVTHKTGLNPIAFKVVVIDEIPKNDAGKVLFKNLEKYYNE